MHISIPDSIWRQYDIRGVVPNEVNTFVAEQVGKAFGTLIKRSEGDLIVVASDCRITSPELRKALIEGILKTGCNVQDIGMVPTPLMYFAVIHFRHDAGIIVTASHNPPQYNGFKMRTYERAFYGKDIQDISRLVRQSDFESGTGSLWSFDVVPSYLEYIESNISLIKPLTIVIDAGNGSTGPTAVKLFKRLGCEVIPLFCEPDGNFPNHIPDPTIPENMLSLREKVISAKADMGVAFDGDGDRVAAVTPSGELLWGDKMLSIFVDSVLRNNPGPVVFDVKCSMSLIEKIEKMGGTPVMWKTGYPLIQSKMKEVKSVLAGEMSGHMYFADRYYGYDDGIYAACRLAEILSGSDRSLSEIAASLPDYPSTPELRLFCPEEAKFKIIEKLSDYIEKNYNVIRVDGLRFSTSFGWGLLRVSNTEPAIVVRFEAKTNDEIRKIIVDVLRMLKDTPVKVDALIENLRKFE